MSARPPRFFERLLLRSGEGTSVGDGAAADLRREWEAWRASGPPLWANLRYAVEALRVAFRLSLSKPRQIPSAPFFGTLLQDLRYGARGLARSPLFTLVAGATFALGVGATTAMYAAVHGILLEPLPYAEPDRLYTIETNTGGEGWYGSSVPEYLDFEAQIDAFASVAAWSSGDVTMGDTLSPMRVRAAFATASLLPMLGVEPALGRVFTPSEDTPADNRYVVLSHELWRNAYGADRTVVGRTIPLFGVDYTVVGVMPAGFAFPGPEVRAWFPAALNRENPNPRMNHFLRVLARLQPGEHPARAAAQLAAHTARARRQYPEIYSERGYRTQLRSLHDAVVGDVRAPLNVLLGAVALVLIIACANVANLFLSRAEARRRELSVRAALGATRSRLVRQLVGESLLLGLIGGVGGIVIGALAIGAITRFAPSSLPRLDMVRLGAEPLALALLVMTAAGVLFGTVPALRVARGAADGALAHEGRGLVARRSGGRLRRGLVVVQVALACVVAMGAGLMVRTVNNLRAVDPGFLPGHAATLSVSPAFARYAQPEERSALWQRITARIAAIPGVTSVGAASSLPLSGAFDNLSIRVEGRITSSIGDAPDGRVVRVTPGLFEALGSRLLRGRTFTDADRADAAPVVIVSETFARRFWAGQDPIGKSMRVFADGYPWLDVVGVVSDIPHDRLEDSPEPMWYVPHAQANNAYGIPLQMNLVVRTAGSAADIVPAVRAAIAEIDPTAPVTRVRLLDELLGEALAGRHFTLDLLQAFGLVALFLAFIGVYGVASLAVRERHGEIGLRKALGADARSILRLVTTETLAIVAIGCALGLVIATAGARLMRSMLYGVGATDAITLVGTVLVLAVTATAAAIVPARRALRIEPLESLRMEN